MKSVFENSPERYLSKEECDQFRALAETLLVKQKGFVIDKYCSFKALKLAEFTIKRMKEIYQIKKGTSSKPSNCGLFPLFCACKKLRSYSETILGKISSPNYVRYRLIGNVPEKGFISVKKILTLNPDEEKFKGSVSVKTLKTIKNLIDCVKKKAFEPSVTKELKDLKDLLEANNLESLRGFLRLYHYTVKSETRDAANDRTTTFAEISAGEKSMVVLSNALFDDKDIYILDEPELSVGHDYVNRVIVPRIINLSKTENLVTVMTCNEVFDVNKPDTFFEAIL